MLLHHLGTIGLLVGSFYCNYQRIGAIVLLVREPSDVFLYAAKCSVFVGLTKVGNYFFMLLVASWAILRLVVYPLWVVWSAAVESLIYCVGCYNAYKRSWWGFTIVLSLLIPLDIYYFFLIVRVALTKLRKGHLEDVREQKSNPSSPSTGNGSSFMKE